MGKNDKVIKVANDHGPMGWVMFMAYIGAAVYFFQLNQTFLGFFLALLKAAVWPAYVVFETLQRLGVY